MSSLTIAGLSMRSILKIDGPNTTMQSILKNFCEQHKINPDYYGLKYKNKSVDLALPFRLSGIPNNATVEIIKKSNSESHSKGAATLGLQLPDGQRLKGLFPLDYTFWQVLRKFELKEENVNITRFVDEKKNKYCIPSLALMNQEIKTIDELKQTKLTELGLRDNSNALIRLSFIITDKTLDEMLPEIEGGDEGVQVKKRKQTNLVEESNKEVKDQNEMQKEEEQLNSPTLGQQSSSSSDPMEEEEEDIKLENTVAKDIRLFKKGETSFNINFENVEESDFQLSQTELQSMISSLHKVQEGGALLTKQQREKLAEKKERVYSKALIRVRFPDGLMVQGTFKPQHTLKHVYDFVIQTLQNPDTPIYLYVAPPIKRFDDLTQTLKEAKLLPATLINVGLDLKNPNSKQFDEPKLKEELLNQITELEFVAVPKNENEEQKQQTKSKSIASSSKDKNEKLKGLLARMTNNKK
ncbi:hypothetical protein ABK040_001610 [Willaertia magna]